MVPRGEVDYLDLEDPLEENLRKMRETRHSRWPVCRGGMDGVVGIATARLLLTQALRGEKLSLHTDLRPAVFVPDTLSGLDLLAHFRATDVQLALVVNEYGEIQGLVTLQDVLEAITGEFAPQRTEDAWAVQREDGSWLLDGLIPVPELKDRLGLRELPEERRGSYNTLAGMLMLLLDRVPRTGDRVDWGGWRYEIVDMDHKRIDKVLARTLPRGEGDAAGGSR
jgi:putative hemolysin